jgi:hypothetical protein
MHDVRKGAATKALRLAIGNGQWEFAETLRQRLKLYQVGKPYRAAGATGGSFRVNRGGDRFNNARKCQSAYRDPKGKKVRERNTLA